MYYWIDENGVYNSDYDTTTPNLNKYEIEEWIKFMLNKLGLFCRKLRLDNRELLLDMASKLGVSSAFLSKVENGKSKPPTDWESRIINLYSLDIRQKQELKEAFLDALNYKSIDIQNYSDENRALISIAGERFS